MRVMGYFGLKKLQLKNRWNFHVYRFFVAESYEIVHILTNLIDFLRGPFGAKNVP